MLRFAGYLSAWAVLLLAGGWLALDILATDIVRKSLVDLEIQGLVDFETAGLRLPSQIAMSGLELDDPLTGETIVRLEHLEIEAGIDRRPGRWGMVLHKIQGRGGRVVLEGEIGKSAFVRSLGQLIAELSGRRTGPRQSSAPMEFRDIEIVLRSEDMALQVIRDCTVWITERDELLHVDVNLGPDGGRVLLAFKVGDRGSGLSEVYAQNVQIEPPLMAAITPICEDLARFFQPTGRADVQVRVGPDGQVEVDGQLAQATLHPLHVPFALEDVTLPFTWRDNRLLIDDAEVSVAGGTLKTRVESSSEGLEVQAHLMDAELTQELYSLVPGTSNLDWLKVDNGGNVELHLTYLDSNTEAGPRVEGWGGVHAELVHVSGAPFGSESNFEIEHVLGRFDLQDGILQFHDMTGLCASGLVTFDGRFDTTTGVMDIDLGVRDVDLAELHAVMAPAEQRGRELVGWLQGRLDFTGVLGSPSSNRAEGQVSVRAADLFNVPTIGAIANILRPGGRKTGARQRLEIEYRLNGYEISIDQLHFDSEFLPLYSNRGTVSLADQTLDVTIIPARVPLGFVGDVFHFIEGQLIQVHVTGHLGDPSVAVFPVATVTRPITGVFGWLGDVLGRLLGFGD